MNINDVIASELNLKISQIENVITLRSEGATVPFISRYRKEVTGNLDEVQVRDIFDKHDYYTELEDRKQTILKSIEEQGKLTDELRDKILATLQKNELEDLYLPYKPKRRTRAMMAKEKGLEPLAELIKSRNLPKQPELDLPVAALEFVNAEKGVATPEEAIAGASDIIAEEIAENADLRHWLREFFLNHGFFVSKIKPEFAEGTTKYENYREYKKEVALIPPHAMLALRRGETEEVLELGFEFDEEHVLNYFSDKNIFSDRANLIAFYKKAIKDAFSRLMKHSIIGEVRLEQKQKADEESIKVFEQNLRQMLLSAPAGMKRTIGIDPGFRTGCKVAVLDNTGKFIEYKAIFPHNSQNERGRAADDLLNMIKKNDIELIAIGNGTASRETESFTDEVLAKLDKKPIKVVVSESGASIYSASDLAREEFPDLDITVRGAISIARRLQDPLAELVKIDPKSIGVGQYQHDVDQKLLRKKLEESVESCVNYVGVDLNTASKELLKYVSGITPRVAEKIIEWRNQNGAFTNRTELTKIPKLGDKTFEQCAGFLRIRNGNNPLDNTAVHPESYYVVEKFAAELTISLNEVTKHADKIKKMDLKKYIDDKVGEPTLRDIIGELEKPGRDPRDEFKYATFNDAIKEITDLKQGMELEGIITNITNFGAFVDIGVHQDGLVHISELSHEFVKDPTKVVKVGQIVKVTVLDINVALKRIQLSMKKSKPQVNVKKSESKFNVDDLKRKFN